MITRVVKMMMMNASWKGSNDVDDDDDGNDDDVDDDDMMLMMMIIMLILMMIKWWWQVKSPAGNHYIVAQQLFSRLISLLYMLSRYKFSACLWLASLDNLRRILLWPLGFRTANRSTQSANENKVEKNPKVARWKGYILTKDLHGVYQLMPFLQHYKRTRCDS